MLVTSCLLEAQKARRNDGTTRGPANTHVLHLLLLLFHVSASTPEMLHLECTPLLSKTGPVTTVPIYCSPSCPHHGSTGSPRPSGRWPAARRSSGGGRTQTSRRRERCARLTAGRPLPAGSVVPINHRKERPVRCVYGRGGNDLLGLFSRHTFASINAVSTCPPPLPPPRGIGLT